MRGFDLGTGDISYIIRSNKGYIFNEWRKENVIK